MASAFEVLARDHVEVMRRLTELELGPTSATLATPDQLALRKERAQQLVLEQSRHEVVEELYFWPVVRERLPDGADLASQAQDHERQATAVIDQLDGLAPDDERFEARLALFASAARAHIAFEETTVWPALRAVISDREADDLGLKLGAANQALVKRTHARPGRPGERALGRR